jgi:DNA-directed RNA polymerase specialized sigma24 family protein
VRSWWPSPSRPQPSPTQHRTATLNSPHGSLIAASTAVLAAAVTDLPSGCQRLIVMLFKDPPVPYAKISAELGIPIGSIGPTRSRCLDKLRRHPAIAALVDAEQNERGKLETVRA